MFEIIIVNYNSTQHLIKCLESIYKTLNDLHINIFIQDNASTDNVDLLKKDYPLISITINHSNIGFAKAVNQALKLTESNYVILLNPDTYITEGFFKNSIEFMEKYPNIGLIGPKILDTDGKLQNSARSFPNPLTAFFGRTSFFSRIFPNNPITIKNLSSLQSDGKTPMEVDWVSGACMVVRRKAIEKVGLLDERFFMYWEDADWCRRMWKNKWKVVYYPRISIYHHAGASSKKNVWRCAFEFHKSVYRLFDKYLAPSLWIVKPFVICGLSIRLLFVLISHLLVSIKNFVKN
ncbi:Glycosyl transferase, family II [Desulfonema limicola]|uniref:Glycosyl transferase, family II n=1 Tax=Desulfonema limicola TaxID=45656 RepID=A0A975B7Q6_9BACT|nr:glycosyltransferase family 2 protein [Desulfonema limicola]QTA80416.1 Glycosyl transferase, family II [Desulfonema limicola]